MKETIYTRERFTESIPFRVLQQLAINLGLMPLLTVALRLAGDKANIDVIKVMSSIGGTDKSPRILAPRWDNSPPPWCKGTHQLCTSRAD